MSIKIYNGRKLKDNYSLIELIKFSDNLSKKIKELQKMEAVSFIIKSSERYFDNRLIDVNLNLEGDSAGSESLFSHFNYKLSKLQRDSKLKNYFDYRVFLDYFPLGEKILFFSSCSSMLAKRIEPLINKNSDFYGYWNNVDQEDGVSDKDWKIRGKDWKRAIGPDYVPSNHGFTRIVEYDEYDAIYKFYENNESLLKYIKKLKTPVEDRLSYVVESILGRELIKDKESKVTATDIEVVKKIKKDIENEVKLELKECKEVNSKRQILRSKYKNQIKELTVDLIIKKQFEVIPVEKDL